MAQDPPKPFPDPLPNILNMGSLNLLAGASGIGKTALVAWLTKQLAEGLPLFGHATHAPTAVGYLTADRPWNDTKHWWDAVGFPDVRHYSIVDDPNLKLPNQRQKHLRVDFFKQCVLKLELPPGALVVVDPIALYLGGNLLDYDTVAFACIDIHRWLKTQQYSSIGVAHAAKQRSDKGDRYLRLQDRIAGTTALLGYTGTQMYLAAPEETGDKHGNYTFLWNPHTAKAETFLLQKDQSTGLFIPPLTATDSAQAQGLTEADRVLLGTLFPDDQIQSTQTLVKRALDMAWSRATLFRRLEAFEAAGAIHKTAFGLWKRGGETTH